MNTNIRQFIIAFCLIYTFTGRSQYAIGNLDLDGDLAEWYDETNRLKDLELLEGPSFKILNISQASHQFFLDSYWSEGTITVDGQTFNNVEMLYDLDKDLLLLKNVSSQEQSNVAIKPNQDKIESFILHGAYFRNLKGTKTTLYKDGFYEILYEGKTSGMIAKRIKSKKVNDSGFSRGIIFYDSDKYFLIRDGKYESYKNKRTFYLGYKEYKPQLKKFIKNNSLKIRKGNDRDLRKLVVYCDEIANN